MMFAREREILDGLRPAEISGEVSRLVGLAAESRGLKAPVGAQVEIHSRGGGVLAAEVVGFREEGAIVVPYGDLRGIAAGDRIVYRGKTPRVLAGRHLIGRVLNSSGAPIDAGDRELPGRTVPSPLAPHLTPEAGGSRLVPIHGVPLNPLSRQRILRPLPTGVRAVDGLFTVGRGQRMGIFAGSGVGKSVLLGMIARGISAPLAVVALIGERGREVREFLERDLGSEARARAVVVVATGDEPALKRVQAALVATAIAEHFCAQGEDVVLLFDSITRVAMAQREIGLSALEPPSTRGYPPSTFALLARLLERAGPGPRGSITAFYSVLVEADDLHDPVCDAVRGILDGHLWLSRDLAGKGHYPPIDPLMSLSRVMPDVVSPERLRNAREMIGRIARYREVEDILQIGAYVPGGDPRIDEAVRSMPAIEAFLRQDLKEATAFEETARLLAEVLHPPAVAPKPARMAEKTRPPPLVTGRR